MPLMRKTVWLTCVLLACPCTAARDNPVTRVVELLKELQEKIETDEKNEADAFEKFAAWCEKTLARKANAIDEGQALMEKLELEIGDTRGKGESLKITTRALGVDIEKNEEMRAEAEKIRENEAKDYAKERDEAEQCIGALESAIDVLTGAGTKKASESDEEAELLSVVSNVGRSLKLAPGEKSMRLMSNSRRQTMEFFLKDPSSFIKAFSGAQKRMSLGLAVPGDYNPASGEIQGILKGLYDSFTADLEKANAEEATKKKAYEELMETKLSEHEALTETLDKQKKDQADTEKNLQDARLLHEETKETLAADKKFFLEAKLDCKFKAKEWDTRTRMRKEELAGIKKAIEILSSDEAKETFDAASAKEKEKEASFLQVQSSTDQIRRERIEAYERLKAAVKKSGGSLRLAFIAATLRTGGHFDNVITMIDKMIRDLRREDERDKERYDQCDKDLTELKYAIEDLETSIKQKEELLERLDKKLEELETDLDAKEEDITNTNTTMNDLRDARIAENKEFLQGVKDDTNAASLLGQAIEAMASFYKNNKIPLELYQEEPADEEKSADEDKAPGGFGGGDYSGRKGESTGIISILTMIKEDFEKQVREAKETEEMAQSEFSKQWSDLKALKHKQEEAKTVLKGQHADVLREIADATGDKERDEDLKEKKEEELAVVDPPCEWVKKTFDSRAEKRAAELAGLMEAKAILAGATPPKEEGLAVKKKKLLFKLPFPDLAPPVPVAPLQS